MKNKNGFTLVELVIIIALLGIIGTIIGPRFTSAADFSTRANKDKVLFLLKSGQKTAIAQRRDISIVLNNNNLSLCYVDTNPCPNNQTVLFQDKPYFVNITGSNLVMPTIKFNSIGGTDAENINIKIDNKDIYIEEESGFIH